VTEKESKKTCSESESERRLLRKYYKHLNELGVDTRERGTRLQHAKFMCLKAESFPDGKKLSRWLGWVQGMLVTENIYGLAEVIEHTREEMKKE